MLSALKEGPPNLRLWADWARSSDPKSRIFINGKCDWQVSTEYNDVVERLDADSEVRNTEWGNASLVKATLAMLEKAVKYKEATHFTHYALVSDDSVPLREIGDLNLEPDTSQISYFELSEGRQQQRVQSLALRKWKGADNWWVTNADSITLPHSQWWVMTPNAALACVEHVEIIHKMADDYDQLFHNTGFSVHTYVNPDEIVFGTFLNTKGFPNSDKVSMSEKMTPDGRHSQIFNSIDELRGNALNARTAPFGRKVRKTLA